MNFKKVNLFVLGNFKNFVDFEILKEVLLLNGCQVGIFSKDINNLLSDSEIDIYSYNIRYLFKLFASKKSYIDIRTFPISNNKVNRHINLLAIRFVYIFKSARFIFQDELVKNRVVGSVKHNLYAPIGVQKSWLIHKKTGYYNLLDKKEINLIYAGSLANRNFKKFFSLQDANLLSNVRFHFMSDHIEEFKMLQNEFGHKFELLLHPTVCRSRLPELLINYDCGLSWIDCNSIYNFQVPTKVYDFISLNMPCLCNITDATKIFFAEEKGLLLYDSQITFGDFIGYSGKYESMEDNWFKAVKIILGI